MGWRENMVEGAVAVDEGQNEREEGSGTAHDADTSSS